MDGYSFVFWRIYPAVFLFQVKHLSLHGGVHNVSKQEVFFVFLIYSDHNPISNGIPLTTALLSESNVHPTPGTIRRVFKNHSNSLYKCVNSESMDDFMIDVFCF